MSQGFGVDLCNSGSDVAQPEEGCTLWEIRVRCESELVLDRVRDRLGARAVGERSTCGGGEKLGNAPDRHRHHPRTGYECLAEREGQPLGSARVESDVGCRLPACNGPRVECAVDRYDLFDSKLAYTVGDLGPERAVTDDGKPNIAVAARDHGDRLQREQRLLDRDEIADPYDKTGGWRDREGRSRVSSRHLRIVVGDATHQDRAPRPVCAELARPVEDRARGRDDMLRAPECVRQEASGGPPPSEHEHVASPEADDQRNAKPLDETRGRPPVGDAEVRMHEMDLVRTPHAP